MRCFFGIDMNDYSKEFEKISATLPDNPEMSKAKEYHITLIFYNDLPEETINELGIKFNAFSFPQFEIEGEKILAFPDKTEPELYSLGFKNNLKLDELYKLIIKTAGVETSDKFDPHITLLRKQKLSPKFKVSKETYSKIDSIKLKIRSFGLYKSEPDKGMNSYSPMFVVKLTKN